MVRNFTAAGEVEKIDLPNKHGLSFLLKTDSLKSIRKINDEINLLCRVPNEIADQIINILKPGNKVKVQGTYRKGREERNPGEFDYNNYLHSKNISGTLAIYNIEDLKIIDNKVNTFQEFLYSARKKLAEIIADLHSGETTALLKGLILADRSDINYETKTEFINAGVVHILAVSGLHVGFIALIFFALFGRLNLYLRSIITIAGVISFMFITGVPPSVFRASVMAVIIILAFLSNRTTNIYNSLAVAALLILIINPAEIFNPGFQLSFSAVLSIAYFYPILRKAINARIRNKSLRNLLLFSAVSISAQIGTLPFTLNYFGKLSFVAIFANLIVIPLVGVIIGTAIITFALFPVSIWAASIYASANNLFSHVLFKIVEFAGEFKLSYVMIRDYSSTDAIIFYLFILTGIFLIRYLISLKSRIIFVFILIANIILFSTLDDFDLLAKNKLNVFMIDVGQGDSFLLKFPDGETALVDAGDATPTYDNGERVILPLLNQFSINKIDYGFVSHIDADHYGGYISLINEGKISKIYKPPLDSFFEKDIRFERFLKSKNIPIEYYSGNKIRLGNSEIFVLNDSVYESNESLSSNDRSGIIKIEYGKTSFLFTGDLEMKGEKYYRNKFKSFLDVDVLKVGHHGSKTGTSGNFLSVTSPEISLISCGIKNKFRHPSPEVINRLKESGSNIYRTDKEGGILLQSDGNEINKIDWKNNY